MLALLDLLAAFDAINYGVLLGWLWGLEALWGTVLRWLSSFLWGWFYT